MRCSQRCTTLPTRRAVSPTQENSISSYTRVSGGAFHCAAAGRVVQACRSRGGAARPASPRQPRARSTAARRSPGAPNSSPTTHLSFCRSEPFDGSFGRAVGFALHVAQEMQAPTRARRGNVEEAPVLVVRLALVEAADELVDRIVLGAGRVDRREQKRRSGVSIHMKSLRSSRPVPAARPGTITVSNSRPFALWIVITCRQSGAEVGKREEVGDRRLERIEVAQRARVFDGLEMVEVDLRVLEVGVALDARRAAEREPCALDRIAQARAAPRFERAGEDRAGALEARAAVTGAPRGAPRRASLPTP